MTNKIPKGLRVLITNNTLDMRAGSELYVKDIALALVRRGHNPIAYSSCLGEVANELRQATIPVIDDLDALIIPPDIIHGQHHLDALTAMLHFPNVPALYFCHGWLPWEELPPIFPSIQRYVAVDDLCRERFIVTSGISIDKVRTLYNFADLSKFKARKPLPEKPISALIFSNYASESNFIGTIRSACHRFGIQKVDVIGLGSGNAISKPETVLPEYDIVFAKARAAIEALAVGCAVIVADFPGLGGMVTTDNMSELRKLNFGVRTMQIASITEENIYNQLHVYNANDAKKVSEWIRIEANLEKAMDTIEEYYADILAMKPLQNQDFTPQALATSKYLRILAPIIKSRHFAEQRAAESDWLEHKTMELEKIIAEKDEWISQLKNEIASLEQSENLLSNTIVEKEKLIQHIYKTYSWKITAPLRIVNIFNRK